LSSVLAHGSIIDPAVLSTFLMDIFNYKQLSIVVIGYNEAKNLENTFQAIKNMNYPQEKLDVIYVDSGSKDISLEIARKYTDNIYVEDKYPSAGRNRNRGLIEAKNEIVHFIDGDVIIEKNYLRNIITLFEEKGVHAIVGQLEEQSPSFFNRIAALSNANKKEGYTNSTSTGATYLRTSLLSVNGYDERIRRGQETELGERFKEAGFKIWCTRHKMGSHNFSLNSIWDYAKKYTIDAKTLFQLAILKGDSRFYYNARIQIFKATIKLFACLASIILSVYFEAVWILISYILIATLSRNKTYFKRHFKKTPGLVFYRTLIDFFLIFLWWFALFKESFSYLFNKSNRLYYSLKKDILLDQVTHNKTIIDINNL
jgi:glycosyltransferase involved in cell wall biosynthesis